MLHKVWNSKGEMPYRFPRASIKFQGHTVQNITDFDPNWAFPDYRPVAAFKSLRFALFIIKRFFLKIFLRMLIILILAHECQARAGLHFFLELELFKASFNLSWKIPAESDWDRWMMIIWEGFFSHIGDILSLPRLCFGLIVLIILTTISFSDKLSWKELFSFKKYFHSYVFVLKNVLRDCWKLCVVYFQLRAIFCKIRVVL